MVSKRKQIIVWLIWIMVWPSAMIWLYNHHFFGGSFQFFDLSVFVILGIMVASFRITINKTPIFLINSVSLATFLIFGLFAEIIVTQIAVLFVLTRLRISKGELTRIPLNLLLFLVVSILSALVYYSVATIAPVYWVIFDHNILQLLAYVTTSFITNQLILYLIKRYYYRINNSLLTEGFYFSLLSISYTLPTSVIIVYLYHFFGLIGILMISIQILAISISIKLNYKGKKINENLHQVNRIAQKLAEHLTKEDLVNTYLDMLPERFPIETMALYDIVE